MIITHDGRPLELCDAVNCPKVPTATYRSRFCKDARFCDHHGDTALRQGRVKL